MKITSLIFLLALSVPAFADLKWRDAETGTQYLLLSNRLTAQGVHQSCDALGWDVFNFEYLTADEQKRFLASKELETLGWTKLNPGAPSERLETEIWGSSEFGVIPTHGSFSASTSTVLLQRFADDNQVRARVGWGRKEDERHALCMYQSRSWVGCSHELHCKYDSSATSTYTLRYSMYEYGDHERTVMNRLKDRVKNFPGGVGGKCDLAIRDPYCLTYR